ncbi:MAG: hypothetical protein PHS62_05405 [Patescibacteria group bacterium]|nr:hypothetical protein [Patescibacteria group bacterium]
MMQRISRIVLNKNLSASKLNSKVGGVAIGGNVQRGVALKKTLINLGAGKTESLFKKQLEREGVFGSQMGKREKILKLVHDSNGKKPSLGDKTKAIKASDGKTLLTDKQIANNLNRTRDRGDSWSVRGENRTKYGGGSVVSHGVYGASNISGNMGNIGINKGSVGFAGNYRGNKPASSAPTKLPPMSTGGVKPIGM